MSDPMPADKVEVKVSGKTVFVNGKEIGTAKLECDAQLAARELQSAFAEVRAQAMEEAAKIPAKYRENCVNGGSENMCCGCIVSEQIETDLESLAEECRRASGKDDK
jgi:hypothetical protein